MGDSVRGWVGLMVYREERPYFEGSRKQPSYTRPSGLRAALAHRVGDVTLRLRSHGEIRNFSEVTAGASEAKDVAGTFKIFASQR